MIESLIRFKSEKLKVKDKKTCTLENIHVQIMMARPFLKTSSCGCTVNFNL